MAKLETDVWGGGWRLGVSFQCPRASGHASSCLTPSSKKGWLGIAEDHAKPCGICGQKVHSHRGTSESVVREYIPEESRQWPLDIKGELVVTDMTLEPPLRTKPGMASCAPDSGQLYIIFSSCFLHSLV